MASQEREEKQITRQERRQSRKDNGRKMRMHGRRIKTVPHTYGKKNVTKGI